MEMKGCNVGQIYEGYGANVEVTDDGIVIRRKGLVSFSLHGLKGDKRIPFGSIAAVQFKPANMLTSGYIQFSIVGGVESRGGIIAATKDENTVLFKGGKQNKIFEQLREVVEAGVKRSRAPVVASASITPTEQLEKLAGLLDRGLLTREEFNQQKAALLG
ncbi:SHOCT domain-containing protein [Novosphingobium resinovorum]|uniref:DUF4429 domain-containing protein n=1 Tax=Novosphingobium TaxID=165696 RepID=UPI001B3C90E6|nr:MULTISPECIES: SHOCT domain-containing protein [Novosphingobium]MBF7010584.1 SHOCT domain-containing protein [Novosphingobium sp. HR1a]WJM28581.1 SHOCT domain-containing protein [Novosphingobium resinovorum]